MRRLVRSHCMNNSVIVSNFTIRTVLYVMWAYVQAQRSMTEKCSEKFRDFVVNVQVLSGYKSGGKSTICPSDEQVYFNKFALESFGVRLRKSLRLVPFPRPTENFYLSSITFTAKP